MTEQELLIKQSFLISEMQSEIASLQAQNEHWRRLQNQPPVYDEVAKLDPDWSITYTPWGDRVICHLTINHITRSAVAHDSDTAFHDAFRFFA